MASSVQISFVKEADVPVVSEFIYLLIDELAEGAGPDREAMTTTTRQVLAMNSVTGIIASEGSKPLGVIVLNERAAVYAGDKLGKYLRFRSIQNTAQKALLRSLLMLHKTMQPSVAGNTPELALRLNRLGNVLYDFI